jgi:hypothetical protein
MEHRSDDLRIESKWSTGQRTPLWDALWHRILAGIGPDGPAEQPAESAGSRHPKGQSQ